MNYNLIYNLTYSPNRSKNWNDTLFKLACKKVKDEEFSKKHEVPLFSAIYKELHSFFTGKISPEPILEQIIKKGCSILHPNFALTDLADHLESINRLPKEKYLMFDTMNHKRRQIIRIAKRLAQNKVINYDAYETHVLWLGFIKYIQDYMDGFFSRQMFRDFREKCLMTKGSLIDAFFDFAKEKLPPHKIYFIHMMIKYIIIKLKTVEMNSYALLVLAGDFTNTMFSSELHSEMNYKRRIQLVDWFQLLIAQHIEKELGTQVFKIIKK